ncbi:asparagine synthase (glutamine-hydrolyzing) [Pseudodesulfovibrio tunisiensis]|uniref:asparagine synthase (glutamine-hydrolyzing) n=1 Tax=Pseudodesulfovibrio tunisiensis TaxID=463192 RepID=UPI001FB2072C|nr:asparagine synthase (glutamine-hydrolyzing) [Pseudodesulfovibrio tunisiensis]
MCGIIGTTNGAIELNLASLHHRGPDGNGLWKDSGCKLGHTRLAIIDTDRRASQPMHSQCGRYAIVFNGEIYNYIELKENHLQHFSFRTSSDTEVLVELWAKLGTKCLPLLRGMFAFAIWDKKEKELYLVRDRMGKKPLVYSCNDNFIYFASELNSLAESLPVSPSINPQAIDLFLAYQFIPAPYTIYDKCWKLPPAGHYARFKDGQLLTECYWRLDFTPNHEISEKTAFEELESLIKESVKLRLRSDVEVGVLLSGGVDSSLVAAVAAEMTHRPLKTFSVGFNYGKSELAYAQKVAECCHSDHHPKRLDEKTVSSFFSNMITAYGEPYGDNSALPSLFVCSHAASQVKVVLNGDGGDELMGGYGKYNPKRLRKLFSPFALSGHALGCIMDDMLTRHTSSTKLLSFADRLNSSLSPYNKVLRFNHFFSTRYRRELYRPEVFDQILPTRTKYERHLLSELNLDGPLLNQLQQIDYKHYLAGDLLPKMDIAGMQNSLEARSPLLDHVLFEFTAKLPPNLKIKNGENKWLLKKLAAKYLPHDAIYRPKVGFSVPISDWAKTILVPRIQEFTSTPNHPLWQYLNKDFVSQLVAGDMKKQRKNSQRMWLISILGSWLKKYVH